MSSLLLYPIFIFCLVLTLFSLPVTSVTLFDYNILIYNQTPNVVQTQCSVGGKDIGNHPIQQKGEYTITIPIVIKGDNTIVCNISSGPKHGVFQLFNFDNIAKLCQDKFCVRDIREDGICLLFTC